MEERKYIANRDVSKSGTFKGFHKQNNGYLSLAPSRGKALFLSEIICAEEENTVWSHLHVSMNRYRTLQIYVIIDDDKQKLEVDNDAWEDYFLTHYNLMGNQKDLLLFKQGTIKGKYLRFLLRCYALKGEDIYLAGFNITFPLQTLTSKMAHPFHENYDLMYFLAPYQQAASLMKFRIHHFSKRLNVKTTDLQGLYELAKWLGYEEASVLEDKILRKLLLNNAYLKKYKGCMRYYERLVSILWDGEAFIQKHNGIMEILAMDKGEEKNKILVSILLQKVPPYKKIKFSLINYASLDYSLYLECNSIMDKNNISCLDNQCFFQ